MNYLWTVTWDPFYELLYKLLKKQHREFTILFRKDRFRQKTILDGSKHETYVMFYFNVLEKYFGTDSLVQAVS